MVDEKGMVHVDFPLPENFRNCVPYRIVAIDGPQYIDMSTYENDDGINFNTTRSLFGNMGCVHSETNDLISNRCGFKMFGIKPDGSDLMLYQFYLEDQV